MRRSVTPLNPASANNARAALKKASRTLSRRSAAPLARTTTGAPARAAAGVAGALTGGADRLDCVGRVAGMAAIINTAHFVNNVYMANSAQTMAPRARGVLTGAPAQRSHLRG